MIASLWSTSGNTRLLKIKRVNGDNTVESIEVTAIEADLIREVINEELPPCRVIDTEAVFEAYSAGYARAVSMLLMTFLIAWFVVRWFPLPE